MAAQRNGSMQPWDSILQATPKIGFKTGGTLIALFSAFARSFMVIADSGGGLRRDQQAVSAGMQFGSEPTLGVGCGER